jgi:hypothetical protein
MVMKDLESTLASALQDEADRTTLDLDTADAASRLEARFDQVDRDRRHRTWATALTAAAAVLVAGGVYGVTKISSGETTVQPAQTPSTPTPSTSTTFTQTFKVLVGNDDNGAAIHAHLTLYGPSWGASDHPVLSDSTGRYGGLAIYRPLALAAGTGCLSDHPNTHVAQTPQKLAQQLARLPRSTVLQSPTPVRSFGRQAIHLQLRINPDCGKDVYRVAETVAGGHGISYGKPSRHVVIDFWVGAVRGVPVVVETWHQDGASNQMVNQIASTRKSITFLNRG